MKLKTRSNLGTERLWLMLRWALLGLGLALFASEGATTESIASVGVLLAAAGVVGRHAVSRSDVYQRWGQWYMSGCRLADAIVALVASSSWTGDRSLAALAFLPVVAEAVLQSNSRRAALFAGLVAGCETLLLLVGAVTGDAWQSTVVWAGIATMGGIMLRHFRMREVHLDLRDQRLENALRCMSTVASVTDIKDLILHILRTSVNELDADAGYVTLVDEDDPTRIRTEAAYSPRGAFAFPTELQSGSGLTGYTIETRQPVALHGRDENQMAIEGVPASVNSALCLPMVARNYVGPGQTQVEQVLGAITLLSETKNAFTDREDIDFVRSLGSLLAVTVANVRMEERQRSTFLKTMESLAKSLEARDTYTRGHSERVCEVSMLLGEELGFSAEALEELRIGTILHDIGKIGVPDSILNKRSRLTDDEFAVMRKHPTIGYDICSPLNLSEGVLMIIRNHHERLDGTGYPDGLKSGELPLSLRIVCVADAFDAMSSKRPYRNVMEIDEVMKEMSRGAGTQFDPVVVMALRKLLPDERFRAIYRQNETGQVEGNAEVA